MSGGGTGGGVQGPVGGVTGVVWAQGVWGTCSCGNDQQAAPPCPPLPSLPHRRKRDEARKKKEQEMLLGKGRKKLSFSLG